MIDSVPPCETTTGDGTVSLESGCVDGLCSDQTWAAIDKQHGHRFSCTPQSTPGHISCKTPDGLSYLFDHDNDTGQPDLEAMSSLVHIVAPFDGQTDDGLGLGVSMSCVLEALGSPCQLKFTQVDDRYVVSHVTYKELRAHFSDSGNSENGKRIADGYLDRMAIGGPR